MSVPFQTEEEIFGGAAGEEPGSPAAYQKELARHRFLMKMQREFNEDQLGLQRDANAAGASFNAEQLRLHELALKEQREFNEQSLSIQRQQAETANDQGRSARASLVIGAGSMVVAAFAILASILWG